MVRHKALALTTLVGISISIGAMRLKVRQIRAAVKQVNEAPIAHGVRLAPGPLGIRMDTKTGEVDVVHDGQSKDTGMMVGMITRKLDGADYKEDLLRKRRNGNEVYTVVLDRPKEQPLIDEPLGTATSNSHYEQHLFDELEPLYEEDPLANEITSDTHYEGPNLDEILAFDLFVVPPPVQVPPASLPALPAPQKKRKCDRSNARLWSADEDEQLKHLVAEHGSKSWVQIATHIRDRSGKQCRERWLNQLRPHLKRGEWTPEEDEQIWCLVTGVGATWAQISKQYMPSRTEHDIKNRWNVLIKKPRVDQGRRRREHPS